MKPILLLCVLFAMETVRAAETGPFLTDLRYSVRGGSRLTLAFSGPAEYAAAREGDQYTLIFARAGVAPYPGGARLKFVDGLVQGVTVERLRPTGCKITITTRPGAEIDIPAVGTSALMTLSARPGERKRGAERPVPPLEMNGGSAPNGRPVPLPAAIGEDNSRSTGEGSQQHAVLLAGVSISQAIGLSLSSLIGTMIVMGVMMRRSRQERGAVRRNPPPASTRQGGTVTDSSREPVRTEEPPEIDGGEDTDGEEKESDRLSATFLREPAEVRLARRLRGGGTNPVLTDKITRLAQSCPGTRRRLAGARKLGIGIGEVELAVRLEAAAFRAGREENAK